jgi:anaerobic selenocysteine-containing dehydrogenase
VGETLAPPARASNDLFQGALHLRRSLGCHRVETACRTFGATERHSSAPNSGPSGVDHRVTEEPDRWVQSACVLCSNGCGVDIGVKDNRIVGVRGRASDLVNRGRLGPKGLNGWEANNSADRLTHPLIRRAGNLERTSWDEAMDLIVSRTRDLRARYTASAIGFYTTGQLFLEEYYTLGVIGKAGLGTPHMDGNTRLCTATAAAALKETFGSDGQPGSYFDIDETDCIVMVGHNMAATDTVLWMRVLDRRRGPRPPKLIVIDPRATATAKEADIHLAPRVGTNVALLNGILHMLIENGSIDRAFIEAHTVGFEELQSTVTRYPPERASVISGVPVAQIEAAARAIGEARSLVCTCLQGVYQSNQATAAAVQVNNINLIRGMIGRPGCGLLQMNGQPTAQNTRETGADGDLPAFRNWDNPEHIEELARIWNVEASHDSALGAADACAANLPLLRDRVHSHALDPGDEPGGLDAEPAADQGAAQQSGPVCRRARCVHDRDRGVRRCRSSHRDVGRKDRLFHERGPHGAHLAQGGRATGRSQIRPRHLPRLRETNGFPRQGWRTADQMEHAGASLRSVERHAREAGRATTRD